MRKVTNDIYVHRNRWIIKDEQGIYVEGFLHLFKTFNDAKNFIDKIHDGTNKKEPIIIGEWSLQD